jgi:hypothetical protein
MHFKVKGCRVRSCSHFFLQLYIRWWGIPVGCSIGGWEGLAQLVKSAVKIYAMSWRWRAPSRWGCSRNNLITGRALGTFLFLMITKNWTIGSLSNSNEKENDLLTCPTFSVDCCCWWFIRRHSWIRFECHIPEINMVPKLENRHIGSDILISGHFFLHTVLQREDSSRHSHKVYAEWAQQIDIASDYWSSI